MKRHFAAVAVFGVVVFTPTESFGQAVTPQNKWGTDTNIPVPLPIDRPKSLINPTRLDPPKELIVLEIKGEITELSAREFEFKITKFSKDYPSTQFWVMLDTNGGNVEAGNKIINAIKSVPQPVDVICTKRAQSMGFMIFATLPAEKGKRLATPECKIISHAAYLPNGNGMLTLDSPNLSQADRNALLLRRFQFSEALTKRIGGVLIQNRNTFFKATDSTFPILQALDLKIIDGVVTLSAPVATSTRKMIPLQPRPLP